MPFRQRSQARYFARSFLASQCEGVYLFTRVTAGIHAINDLKSKLVYEDAHANSQFTTLPFTILRGTSIHIDTRP